QEAVNAYFPSLGAGFVAISLFFFAFTTIMAYYYIAETNLSYLNGKKQRPWTVWALRFLILFATFFGTIKSAELAWTIGDIGVGLMAWLNIVAIFLLRKPAFKALQDYRKQKAAGLDPQFDPEKLGIKNTSAWKKE